MIMFITSIGDSDDMNHDNDDVMVSLHHYATLRNGFFASSVNKYFDDLLN